MLYKYTIFNQLLLKNSEAKYNNLNEVQPSTLTKEFIKAKATFSLEKGGKSLFFLPINLCEEDSKKMIIDAFSDYKMNIFNTHAFFTKDEAKQKFAYELEKCPKKGCFTYFVCYTFTKKKAFPVGLIHIFKGSSPKELSFYFFVLEPLQRQGIGTGMALAIITAVKTWKKNKSHVFNSFVKDVTRIQTCVDSNNVASNAVFIKLKFEKSKEPQRILDFPSALEYVYVVPED